MAEETRNIAGNVGTVLDLTGWDYPTVTCCDVARAGTNLPQAFRRLISSGGLAHYLLRAQAYFPLVLMRWAYSQSHQHTESTQTCMKIKTRSVERNLPEVGGGSLQMPAGIL